MCRSADPALTHTDDYDGDDSTGCYAAEGFPSPGPHPALAHPVPRLAPECDAHLTVRQGLKSPDLGLPRQPQSSMENSGPTIIDAGVQLATGVLTPFRKGWHQRCELGPYKGNLLFDKNLILA